jgi:hypothetical protein
MAVGTITTTKRFDEEGRNTYVVDVLVSLRNRNTLLNTDFPIKINIKLRTNRIFKDLVHIRDM